MDDKPVIFQGTFDPFTNGHLFVLKTALKLFGQVHVLLLINPNKRPLFSVQERQCMIKQATADLAGVSVSYYDGLLVEYMRLHGLTTCVRGIRNEQDAAYELHNARLSQALYPALNTLLVATPSSLKDISSSTIKKAFRTKGLPAGWVPAVVEKKLAEKFSS